MDEPARWQRPAVPDRTTGRLRVLGLSRQKERGLMPAQALSENKDFGLRVS